MRKLMSSNNTSRRELRNAYGLRDVEPVTVSGSKALEATIFGVMIAVVLLLLLCLCVYVGQLADSYARKNWRKINPYYTTAPAATAVRTLVPPPPPPLQSTEL
ncbi:hypothetical protein COOONC_21440 [Cooperia oncophora]